MEEADRTTEHDARPRARGRRSEREAAQGSGARTVSGDGEEGWWRFAWKFLGLSKDAQRKLTPKRSTRAHLVRIGALHRALGETLDTRRAPLRCYRFVAYAPDRLDFPLTVGQQARYEALLRFTDTHGRWPHYRELKDIAQAAELRWTGRVTAPRAVAPISVPSFPSFAPSPPHRSPFEAAPSPPPPLDFDALASVVQDPTLAGTLRKLGESSRAETAR